MSFDAYSLTAPARIRVLAIPVGKIKQSRFDAFARRLQRENVVRLGDVSPDNRPNKTLFSPLAFPDGLVLLDILRSLPSSSQQDLVPFEIYRSTLLVIGIVDWKETSRDKVDSRDAQSGERDAETLSRSLEAIRDAYPSIWTHRLLAFDCEEQINDLPPDIALIPPRSKAKTTTMKTIMCDITAALLGDMSVYGKSLQDHASVETPKALPPQGLNGTTSPPPSLTPQNARPMSMAIGSGYSSPTLDDRLNNRLSMPISSSYFQESQLSSIGSRSRSPIKGNRTPPTSRPAEEGLVSSGPSSPRKASAENPARSPERMMPSGDLERTRGKARVGVVLGSLYLLAGRWPDAVRELSKSVLAARSSSDYVWQAKAMDHLIVCLIVGAWAGMDFKIPDVLRPASEVSQTGKLSKHSPSNSQYELSFSRSTDQAGLISTLESFTKLLPNLIYNIINLYGRAYTFTDDKLPSPSFECSAIRFAKLLTALHASHGKLDQHALSFLVQDVKLNSQQPPADGQDNFPRKVEIVQIALRAYPVKASDSSASAAERLSILAGIASVLSDAGQYRKLAMILREIISAVLPPLIQARKDDAAEMGIHPAASLAAINKTLDGPAKSSSTASSGDMEQGMRSFLALACQTLGVRSAADPGALKDVEPEQVADFTGREIRQPLQNAYGARNLKIDLLWACIAVCEALPDLSSALQFSAELLRTASSASAPAPESSNGAPDLPIEAQERLANGMNRTIGTAEHLGVNSMDADYWDDFLVRSVEFLGASQLHPLTPHRRSELNVAIEEQKGKDPFIHNPFLKSSATSKQDVLVAGEEAVFRVMLQNLYDFELVIESIQLVSDNASMECPSQSVFIGPYRTQTMLLYAMPTEAGNLVITGCMVKVRGCRQRQFSIFQEPWALKTDEKGKNIRSQPLEDKNHSTRTAESSKKVQTQNQVPAKASLPLRVIPNQPVLALQSNPLPQAALMLFEGDHKSISLTLRNNSATTQADLILVSFKDSWSSDAQDMLTDQKLSSSELYDTELMMAQSPVFRLRSPEHTKGLKLMPHGDLQLDVEVYGRLGLTEGMVQVDYGFLGSTQEETTDQFYTRQLRIPLAITVVPMLSLTSYDIIKLNDQAALNSGSRPIDSASTSQQTSPEVGSVAQWSDEASSSSQCLLLLDFHNRWTSTLTLEIHTQSTGGPTHPTFRCAISPGCKSRVPLPLSRIYIPISKLRSPIPSFNPAKRRQFVVSSTLTSVSSEREAREAFWLREALLSQISASWSDTASGQQGTIDLRRTLKMTPAMREAYRLSDISFQFTVSVAEGGEKESSSDDESCSSKTSNPQTFRVPIRKFLCLTTRLYNRSSSPITSVLRLQPSLAHHTGDAALDLHRKLFVSGMTQLVLPPLQPGEETEIKTGFLILCRGVYEWSASVEDLSTPKKDGAKALDGEKKNRPRAATGEIDLDVGDEGRRIWVAEQRCIVIARVDGDQ